MDIETLRLFCDVIDLKGFTPAAAANSITQSAVSQRLKSLENRFGIPLIERHGAELSLTKAGEIVYRTGRRILGEFRDAEERVHELKGRGGGSVRVAAIYSVGLYELDPFVKRCLENHPDLDVQIEYGRANKIYQDTVNGSIDLGIVAYPLRKPQLSFVPLRDDELVLISHAEHSFPDGESISLKQLESQPFVTFHRNVPTRRAIDEIFKTHGVSVVTKAVFENIELIKRGVEIGLGLSLVPSTTVRSEIQAGLLKSFPLVEGPFMRPIAVLFRRGRSLPLSIRTFLAVLTGDD